MGRACSPCPRAIRLLVNRPDQLLLFARFAQRLGDDGAVLRGPARAAKVALLRGLGAEQPVLGWQLVVLVVLHVTEDVHRFLAALDLGDVLLQEPAVQVYGAVGRTYALPRPRG